MSESLVPPILNPSSLYKEEARRDATRIRIYNSVLQNIYNKVKAIARIPGNERVLWYVVPEFIPGTPRFDMADAILYIVWNLRNVGYTVDYTHPNLLYISWKSHDERYKAVESPWSRVLQTARSVVLGTEETVYTPPIATRSAAAPATAATDIHKRKTALKKTGEYRPIAPEVPVSSVPSIASAMYLSAPPTTSGGPKHVSFV